jgi:SsrA-binding protein
MSIKKARKPVEKRILNRRARHDYEIGDIFNVGLVLTGSETKSLRLGHGHLQGSYVSVKDNELWLINATIHGAGGVIITESDQTRSRKILSRRKEIKKMIAFKDQGLSIIPLEINTNSRYIKLKIAVGKNKKQYDKRATLKARDAQKKIQSTIKSVDRE